MSVDQCQDFFSYIMKKKEELIDFDRASLLKSMADIPNFKDDQIKQVIELSMTHLERLHLKDLTHIILGYVTTPPLYAPDQVSLVLNRI